MHRVHQSTPAIFNLPHGDPAKRRRISARYALLPINFSEVTANGSSRVQAEGHMRATGINLGGVIFFNSIDTTVAIKQFGRRYEQIESPLITVNYGRSRCRGYPEKNAHYCAITVSSLLRGPRSDEVARLVFEWIRKSVCTLSHTIVGSHFVSAVLTFRQRNRRRTMSMESIRRIPKW